MDRKRSSSFFTGSISSQSSIPQAENLSISKLMQVGRTSSLSHIQSQTGANGEENTDHCLDFLRQSILCNLDYSMYTVYWGERRQDIPTHQMPGKQKCVNWDKLHSWMLGRAASVDDLVRPQSDA